MSFLNSISENVILPISDIVTGQYVYNDLRFLNKSQYWTRNQINRYQTEKLKLLIKHSVTSVPYYRELFYDLRLRAEDIQCVEDLEKIPILAKTTFYEKGIEMFTSQEISKRDRFLRSSSGSTGEPLFYYSTKPAYSMNLAAILRGWYWMGFRLGDKYVKLSQNPRKDPIKRLQDKMSGNLYMATNPLIDSNYDLILKEIERYKPKIVRCYPDPLLFLARYKQNHSEFSYRPHAITTTGNTLHAETRAEIEAAFGCKIFDSYSCEGNSAVFECPTHNCYHSAEEYGISEVVDENGISIKSGIGRLISTDLMDLAFPFIRYDTQDLVEISDEPCSCGRKHLRINKIIGRDNDVLVVPSGRKFIVHNFTGFFQTDHVELNRSIDQFQIVKKKSVVIIRIVPNHRFSESVGDYIKRYWEREMGIMVIVEILENIPLTKSGKRRFIINE